MSDTAQSVTIRYAIMPSPIGELFIAATASAVVHLAFENHDFHSVRAKLEAAYGMPVQRDDAALEYATQQLAEYFAGTRKYFELPVQQPAPDRFMTRVQQNLSSIPYGETRSYGQFATQLENPGAARAVGSACARNPIPLIQPCHRVVRSDGSHGEFSGTAGAKQYLLAFERGERPNAPTS